MVPGMVRTEKKYKAIDAGSDFCMAIDENNKLWAWGDNYRSRQLGNWSSTAEKVPVQVMTDYTFSAIATGSYYTLAIDESGNLLTWGNNTKGQLGNSTVTEYSNPMQIPLPVKLKSVAARDEYSLALDVDGHIWAWGDNSFGQLGDSTMENSSQPQKIAGNRKFKAIAAGRIHSLAIDTDDRLWGWGASHDIMLDGSGPYSPVPVPLLKDKKIKSIAAGYFSSFVIDENGNTWAFGLNDDGQLGNNTAWNEFPQKINGERINSTGVVKIVNNGTSAFGTKGQIYVRSKTEIIYDVISIMGKKVKSGKLPVGESFITMPTGLYIFTSHDGYRNKVFVK